MSALDGGGPKPENDPVLSVGQRFKAQMAKAQSRTQKFYVPTTDPNPDLRFVVELNNSVKDEDDVNRVVNGTNGQLIAESTEAVYYREGPHEELVKIQGGWTEVGVMLEAPAGWGKDRIVLLACESDALLLLKLSEEFAEWRAGQIKVVVDILGT